jgi:hypothetical protein
MTATGKEAGKLQPGDLIQVAHHDHDGPPCCGDWCVEAAIVDEVDAARVTADKIAVVGWHDADHPNVCGVFHVPASTRIPFLRAAA